MGSDGDSYSLWEGCCAATRSTRGDWIPFPASPTTRNGEMDRRTLFALLLATIVLIVYQLAFAPKPKQGPTDQAAHTSSTADTRSELPEIVSPVDARSDSSRTTATAGVLEPANVLLGSEPPSAPIPVRLGQVEAAVNPAGGVISRWSLLEYTDASSQPANLVRSESIGLFTLAALTDHGRVEFSDVPFAVEQRDTANGPEVLLRAQHPSGWAVDLKYLFARDGYSADLEVLVTGMGRDPELVVTFPGDLPHLETIGKQDEQAASALALVGDKLVKERHSGKKAGWAHTEAGQVQWIGQRTKYFLAAVAPKGARQVEMASAGSGIENAVRIPLTDGATRMKMYAGPMEHSRLESYQIGLDRAIDLGWKPIVPFSRLLLNLMNFLHGPITNYGVVILIVSVASKLVFYPLTRKSIQSMQGLQALKPEMDRVNQEFKNDPQRKQQAMLELYRKHKVNPVSGCLPMIIQMPVFIALYNVLANAIELRKEPFVWWIQDLSAPDLVGTVAGFPIHILPLLMAGTMFWQQKLTPTDPRQAIIGYVMPVMMLVFFYMLPSGLVFYWTVTNILQVGQQLIMNREQALQKAAA